MFSSHDIAELHLGIFVDVHARLGMKGAFTDEDAVGLEPASTRRWSLGNGLFLSSLSKSLPKTTSSAAGVEEASLPS